MDDRQKLIDWFDSADAINVIKLTAIAKGGDPKVV